MNFHIAELLYDDMCDWTDTESKYTILFQTIWRVLSFIKFTKKSIFALCYQTLILIFDLKSAAAIYSMHL